MCVAVDFLSGVSFCLCTDNFAVRCSPSTIKCFYCDGFGFEIFTPRSLVDTFRRFAIAVGRCCAVGRVTCSGVLDVDVGVGPSGVGRRDFDDRICVAVLSGRQGEFWLK